jgi:transposase
MFKTFTQPPEPKVLYEYLKKNFPGGTYHSAYEAGFCGFWAHRELLKYGINSMVVNPADIPTTDKEKRQKEDKRDSRKIARALSNGELVAIYVPSGKTIDDRSLLRMHYTLTKDLRRYKQRIKSKINFYGIKMPEEFSSYNNWSKRFMLWLEAQKFQEESANVAWRILLKEMGHLRESLLEINQQIRNLSKTEAYHTAGILLKSVPGIGLLTAMTFLTELETIRRFKNIDKLASFIGFVPSTYSSGDKDITGDITPRKHGILRSALIESAWVAVRIDPAMMMTFQKLCKRMDENQAIVRIAKKLLNRIVHVLRKEELYELSIVK